MHIPTCETQELEILSFNDALENEKNGSYEYDINKWIYVPNEYVDYRYILGTSHLQQDAAELLAMQHQIIGPLDLRVQRSDAADSLRHRQRAAEGDQRRVLRLHPGPQQDAQPHALPLRRRPGAIHPPAPGSLHFTQTGAAMGRALPGHVLEDEVGGGERVLKMVDGAAQSAGGKQGRPGIGVQGHGISSNYYRRNIVA